MESCRPNLEKRSEEGKSGGGAPIQVSNMEDLGQVVAWGTDQFQQLPLKSSFVVKVTLR
jgi:hypothetical protein